MSNLTKEEFCARFPVPDFNDSQRRQWLDSLKQGDKASFVNSILWRFDRVCIVESVCEKFIHVSVDIGFKTDGVLLRDIGAKTRSNPRTWIIPFNPYSDMFGFDWKQIKPDLPLPVPTLEDIHSRLSVFCSAKTFQFKDIKEQIGQIIGSIAFSPDDSVIFEDSLGKGTGWIFKFYQKQVASNYVDNWIGVYYERFEHKHSTNDYAFNPIGDWYYAPQISYHPNEKTWTPRQSAVYKIVAKLLKDRGIISNV